MKKIAIAILLVPVLFLTGCTTTLGCGNDFNRSCEPVSYVYKSMDDGYYDYRKDLIKDKSALNMTVHKEIEIKSTGVAVKLADAGDPILSKPIVSRVLITSYEDDDGDFVEGGFIYIKVKESVWLSKND